MEEEVKSKINIKKIFLIILMVIIELFILIFISTYFRWCDQINNLKLVYGYSNESKIVYEFNNREYEVNTLKDFYGEEVNNLELKENEYIELYCEKDECIYVDNTDNTIMMYLNPWLIVFILNVILLMLFYFFIRVSELKKKIRIISFVCVLISTIVMFFIFVIDFANYYGLVNNSTYLVNGKVVGVIYSSEEYKEVIKYEIRDNSYYLVGSSNTENINDIVNTERTVYYSKRDNSISTVKRLPINLIYLVSFICLLIFSILYFLLIKYEMKG